MELIFNKYHGAGNDFVLIDNRTNFFDKNNISLVEKICDRRFGIGADGLILLENDSNFDFRMVYYNADGKESTMCGNGGRCIVAFAKKLNLFDIETNFIAIDGPHKASIDQAGNVNLKMKDIKKINSFDQDFVLDTGSPHYVKFVSEFGEDFVTEARAIRTNEHFKKEGINVNFVEKISENELNIRTFERGVEDETLACGTGCVAAALSLIHQNTAINTVHLNAKGGLIKVEASKNENGYSNIWLWGPTKFVFEGKYNIN